MVREWADEDTRYQIDEALLPTGRALADMWDDEEAWAEFEATMKAERSISGGAGARARRA